MPQFSESRKAAAAAQLLTPTTETAFRVHALTERDAEPEVLDFLAERPAPTVVMRGLIRDNGFESPFNRGTFHACRDEGGRLEGVALVGHAVYVTAETPAALRAFARVAQEQHSAHVILGERELVGRFWEHYAAAGQTPRAPSRWSPRASYTP